jgi:L-ascorbate metabolism protein UlaG (beta-lactamase superfamily)
MIQTNDQVIYLDPVSLENDEGLPEADIILVTHDHEDHFSADMIAELLGENTKVISITGVTNEFSEENAVLLEPCEEITVNGIEIEGIPAYNRAHSKYSNYLGFVINIGGVRVYCSGDTDFTPEMEGLTDIDIAVLNVRNNYSLSGEDVVSFAEVVKPRYLVPIHWMPDDDTYQDKAAIEYIQQHMPETTELLVLALS